MTELIWFSLGLLFGFFVCLFCVYILRYYILMSVAVSEELGGREEVVSRVEFLLDRYIEVSGEVGDGVTDLRLERLRRELGECGIVLSGSVRKEGGTYIFGDGD